MDSAVLAAIITAAFALLVALVTQRGQIRNGKDLVVLKDRLDAESRHQERQLSARTELNNLREPLLAAAEDLQRRIWNIRKNHFLDYLHIADRHRREVALFGTLHRFATYWALQELLYSRTNLLRFESDPDTKDVAELVGRIARICASDSTAGLNLIFWREEQRAVAELMFDISSASPVPPIMGFATFRNRYDEDTRREVAKDFAFWLGSFAKDLQAAAVSENVRLKELDDGLKELVKALQQGRAVPTETTRYR